MALFVTDRRITYKMLAGRTDDRALEAGSQPLRQASLGLFARQAPQVICRMNLHLAVVNREHERRVARTSNDKGIAPGPLGGDGEVRRGQGVVEPIGQR